MTNSGCEGFTYCMSAGFGCPTCIHNPYSTDPFPVNCFVSFKCGSQATLCSRCYDFDACYDCDPYDPPCSLFHRILPFFGGGENNG